MVSGICKGSTDVKLDPVSSLGDSERTWMLASLERHLGVICEIFLVVFRSVPGVDLRSVLDPLKIRGMLGSERLSLPLVKCEAYSDVLYWHTPLSVFWTILRSWEREELYFLKYRVFWSILPPSGCLMQVMTKSCIALGKDLVLLEWGLFKVSPHKMGASQISW